MGQEGNLSSWSLMTVAAARQEASPSPHDAMASASVYPFAPG